MSVHGKNFRNQLSCSNYLSEAWAPNVGVHSPSHHRSTRWRAQHFTLSPSFGSDKQAASNVPILGATARRRSSQYRRAPPVPITSSWSMIGVVAKRDRQALVLCHCALIERAHG